MIIFLPDDAYEQERKRREERRQEAVGKVVKEYERILDEEKRGIHKSFSEHLEEYYYNNLSLENQMYYDMKRGRL